MGADLTADYENVDDSPQQEILKRATAATSDLAKNLADLAAMLS